MNLREAKDTLESYSYLEGSTHRNQIISMLIIAPKNGEEIGKIIGMVIQDRDYNQILEKYSNFDVFLIFNLDSPNENPMTYLPLHVFLKEQKNP
jgi:hypothetical protein